jgi:uncharacterized DUF497 family protein
MVLIFSIPSLKNGFADLAVRRGRILMIAYTLRRSGNVETIRIISARRASRRERAAYLTKD